MNQEKQTNQNISQAPLSYMGLPFNLLAQNNAEYEDRLQRQQQIDEENAPLISEWIENLRNEGPLNYKPVALIRQMSGHGVLKQDGTYDTNDYGYELIESILMFFEVKDFMDSS